MKINAVFDKNMPIDLRVVHGKYKYILLTKLFFIVNDVEIEIEPGFITDGNTVPRFLWSIYPPLNKALLAAILHDYLYDRAMFTKKIADKIYKEVAKQMGVNKYMLDIAFFCIRKKGKGNY